VRSEHDAADGGHEQHDRGDLEREQVVGQECAAERFGFEGMLDRWEAVLRP